MLQEEQVGEESQTTTRCGRQVKKPARFLVVADQMINQRKVGEVVRHVQEKEGSRERERATG